MSTNRGCIRLLAFCHVSTRKSVSLREFPTFPRVEKVAMARMSGPFPHRNLNLLQSLQLILQDLWESRCLAREWLQIHQKWLAWILHDASFGT